MNVKDLIRLLANYSPDMRVVVNGYEDGYDDLTPGRLTVVKIALNTGDQEWEGQHWDADDSTVDVVDALVLRRVSH